MVEFDLTTTAVIVGMAGIIASMYFNSVAQRRENRRERKKELEAKIAEKKLEEEERIKERNEFINKMDISINKSNADLKENLHSNLEVIKVSTAGLEKRFDDWRIVNRDEIQSIKQELANLYEDLDKVDEKGAQNVDAKIQTIKNKIELLEKRIVEVEFKVTHPYQTSEEFKDRMQR